MSFIYQNVASKRQFGISLSKATVKFVSNSASLSEVQLENFLKNKPAEHNAVNIVKVKKHILYRNTIEYYHFYKCTDCNNCTS